MADLDPVERIMEQEQTIRQLIQSRLAPNEIIHPDQQEAISYRLSEIFVAARTLYTRVLPRFFETDNDDIEVFELFGEVRMNLLNLRDLIADFEETFLVSLAQREEKEADEVLHLGGPEPDENDEEVDGDGEAGEGLPSMRREGDRN